MNDEAKKTEQTPPSADATKAPVEAGKKPDAAAELGKEAITTGRKNLEKAKKASVAAVEKSFDDSFRAGLPERAIDKMKQLKRDQVGKVEAVWTKHEQKVETVTADTTKSTTEIRNVIEEETKAGKEEAEARTKTLEKVIAGLVGDRFTAEKVAQLARALQGVEQVIEADKGTQALFDKIGKGDILKDEFTPQDYQKIVSMLKPQDLAHPSQNPQEMFEASSVGLLITMMRPNQRYKLIEAFMNDPAKASETGQVLDGFLKTGILSVAQGQELLNEAARKLPPIIDDVTLVKMQEHLNKADYQKEVEKLRKILEEEAKPLKGQFADNMMNRIVGAPLVGGIMMFHSIFWLLVNLISNRFDLKTIATNPYIGLAAAELAAGTEIVTGSIVKGAGWGFGYGWVTRSLERVRDKIKGVPTTAEGKAALDQLGDIYANDLDFAEYLNKGGITTILELRKEKETRKKKDDKTDLTITYAELLAAEKSADRKAILEKDKANFSDTTIGKKADDVAKICTTLQVKDSPAFSQKIELIKQAQGLKA